MTPRPPIPHGGAAYLKDGGLALTFAQPADPISTNAANGLHWTRRTAATTPWRDATQLMTRWALRVHAHDRGPWTPQPVTVHLQLAFRTNRRRDPHNYVGTVVKAAVDGLVRGGLIPDDTPEWATIVEPSLTVQADKTQPLMAWVTIRPRSPHHGNTHAADQGR